MRIERGDQRRARYEGDVEPRTLLSDFIRHGAGLTGTKVGCEHGVCGACTVQLDGEPVRSCLMLAVQANGRSLTTVEGLAGGRRPATRSSARSTRRTRSSAASARRASSCRWTRTCASTRMPAGEELREALAGNLCRCTGYLGILEAVEHAAREMRGEDDGRV